ncbi:short chain dehydrogenase [Rhodothalassium salexigens]|uniref:SDR family oxidoreductase n=1 Tax=Rhodothalassium salexigens TaxID=1086 RepID=UPI001914819D|nr:SDR family oxidoreductase [Rhodothalassium salexigens]MBK5911195.1 short chain dehydrogenase [Rhodothalassium salexigens]MBK5921915.1 short chain dehydrogenase [Rhodothalassium salexigens]
MTDLASAPALVTGAGRRIGRHLALSLAARGHPVAVHYNRSGRDAQTVVDRIEGDGGRAVAVAGDLRDEAAVADLVARAGDALDAPIRLLVNNASLFDYDDIYTATRQSWDDHMAVNLRAPFVLSQALAQRLARAETGPETGHGLIVNIIDQRVWRLNPSFTTYTLSKAGLWTLTQTLAQALAPRIRVAAIGPGPVLASIHQDRDSFAAEAANVPLQRGPDLDEIARALDFIIDSPSLTGQMIALDGGQHLAWQTPDVRHGERPDAPNPDAPRRAAQNGDTDA